MFSDNLGFTTKSDEDLTVLNPYDQHYNIIMNADPREIRRYITPTGKIPFTDWLESLHDRKTRLKIKLRLDRVANGNLGDCRSVGDGVFELRINYGSGYRIYFGQIGLTMILLLCGGDKSTQNQDIKTAKKYWKDYENRTTSHQ